MRRLLLIACIITSIGVHAAVISYISAISGSFTLPKVSPERGSASIHLRFTPVRTPVSGIEKPDTDIKPVKVHHRKKYDANKVFASLKKTSRHIDNSNSTDKTVKNGSEKKFETKAKGTDEGKVIHKESCPYGIITQAKPIGSIKPVYPRYCRIHRLEGKVVLIACVDTDGMVKHVYMKHSSAIPQFDDAAIDALKEARFVPALKHGAPVISDVEETFIFRLER